MSMHNNTTHIANPARAGIRVQTGIGIPQVMLILLLVGGALAAGGVLLQAKRAPQQAASQEQTLRWADEALVAFAATHARLPCPANTIHGDENCDPGHAKGWLPLRTLAGASGTGMPIGPIAYMVYRGDETTHLDLTSPGNAYQPPLVDGSDRPIITTDDDGKETSRREFTAVNGLDLCRSLELAKASADSAGVAQVPGLDGSAQTVAYAIAAAGAQAGPDRLDGANASASPGMEAPSRDWDSAYDDRVRVRDFDTAGQMFGCRLLADLSDSEAASSTPASTMSAAANAPPKPGGNTPYNVSLAGMDVLAAAVTLHDALALLQTNNIDATEAAVKGAASAQISLIFKLVTTAASLSDQITTLVTSTVSLTRSIATCIASLGAMCWEVPLKTAAVVTSIVGLGTKGVTLAAKAASLPFVALALDASVKARDLAKQAQTGKEPKNVDEAKDQLRCTLYGTPYRDSEGKQQCLGDAIVVYKRDDNGNPIQDTDGLGNKLYDEYGNPVYVIESSTPGPRIGLDKQTENAKEEWGKLQFQVDKLEEWRLAPWGVAPMNARVDPNGELIYELREITSLGKDGVSRSQIQQRIHPQRTCKISVTSTNWQNCTPQRYRKVVQRSVCKAQSGGTYTDSQCTIEAGTDEDGKSLGEFESSIETDYYFNWDVATNEAIAARNKAQDWIALNKREEELKKEVEQFKGNVDAWFDGSDPILSKMLNQMNDAQHCGGRGRGNPNNPDAELPPGEREAQQCINARNAVRYVEHCEKPVTVNECKFLGDGSGRYTDSECNVRSGSGGGDYGWQERSTGVYEKDTNPLASCQPNMRDRLRELESDLRGLAERRDSARTDYNNLPKPWLAYPGPASADLLPYTGSPTYNWFEWAIETIEHSDGNPVKYDWVRSPFTERYTHRYDVTVDCTIDGQPAKCDETRSEIRTRPLPWYAPENYKDRSASAPLLVTARESRHWLDNRQLELNEIMSEKVCQFFTGRERSGNYWTWPGSVRLDWWNSDTRKFGVYCQRYPYSRAFEDWLRAKAGAENARKHYDDTLAQFNKLKEELDNLNDPEGATGGPTTQMSFGAEATLEHADSRGSTGPQTIRP